MADYIRLNIKTRQWMSEWEIKLNIKNQIVGNIGMNMSLVDQTEITKSILFKHTVMTIEDMWMMDWLSGLGAKNVDCIRLLIIIIIIEVRAMPSVWWLTVSVWSSPDSVMFC